MTTVLRAKVAIVTGGGRGLGRAMALGLARVGLRVAITAARMRDEIEAVAREAPRGQIHPVIADVSSKSACAALIEEVEARLGPVDVLVNNAGRGMRYVSERFLSDPTRSALLQPFGMDADVRDITLAPTSRRLECELLTDECDGLRERAASDAESAFDNARLTVDVLSEIEDRRLALA